MRRSSWLVMAVFCSLVASEAFALFNAELLLGRRWYTIDDDGAQANQATLAAHVDPIPLVPVSLGAAYSQMTLNKDDLGDADSGSITEIGIELKAWVPLVPVVTPYARINVPVSSTYTVEYDGGELEGKVNGYHLGIGGSFSVIPLLSVVVELQTSAQKIVDIEGSGVVAEVPGVLEYEDFDLKSSAFLVGASLGF